MATTATAQSSLTSLFPATAAFASALPAPGAASPHRSHFRRQGGRRGVCGI